MAGNKGRGRAAYTFNIEAVGFSRGDKLPDVVLKPPPLFPDTDYKPVPLKTGEDEDYMLALKQELRETVKRMPYFIEAPEEKQDDIERYSKRYMKIYKEEWIPDWRRLPREMMPRKKGRKVDLKSRMAKAADSGASLSADVLKKIELELKEFLNIQGVKEEELEKRGDGEKSDEENEDKEGSKKKDGDDEDGEDSEQEEYDEEEQEEENDYINSYFEDGDDFVIDSDDNMDEATY